MDKSVSIFGQWLTSSQAEGGRGERMVPDLEEKEQYTEGKQSG